MEDESEEQLQQLRGEAEAAESQLAEQQENGPHGDDNSENSEEMADPYEPLGLEASATKDRMKLSAEERNLAINIKEAISTANDLDPVSDFMCAQLALIDGDSTESALERVYHLQHFREEYGILDSLADGRRRLGAFMDLTPGFHLCFADDMAMGQTVMVFDNTKFSGKEIRTEADLQLWLGATYYQCTIFTPDFDAIRKGVVLVLECEGYDWKMHAEFKTIKRVWSEIATIYPCSFQKLKYFNAGTMMNVVVSMLRPFLPRHLKNKIEVGCQFDKRLDEVYLVPNMEEANARTLSRMEDTLRRRYENEKTFQL